MNTDRRADIINRSTRDISSKFTFNCFGIRIQLRWIPLLSVT